MACVAYQLVQYYPNPFNPVTHFQYQLTDNEKVILTIYDLLGREIEKLVNETQKPGLYMIIWDAAEFRTDLYFYRFEAGTIVHIRKMILLT